MNRLAQRPTSKSNATLRVAVALLLAAFVFVPVAHRASSAVPENFAVQCDEAIARNTLIDHYRRRATRKSAETTFAQEVKITANAVMETQVDTPCKCLGTALLDLKPEYASLLRRADLAEEPRNRIAVDLGITANSLNVRLHRARKALKSNLKKSCPACRADSFMDCECE